MKRLLFTWLLLIFAQAACGGGSDILPTENAPTPTLMVSNQATQDLTTKPFPTPDVGTVPAIATHEAATLQPMQSTVEPMKTQFEEIDKSLSESMKSSIAYNAPTSMKLDDSATIELLLNPVQSPAELGNQITEGGQVVTATIEVTPLMQAVLISADKEAFAIQQLHASSIQPIGIKTVTKWEWVVTAKKAGQQKLTMVISRLVKAKGQDNWLIIETYKSDVDVKVTLAQWLQSLDWKWILGIILTAIAIPAFWRFIDSRKKKRKGH